MLDKIKKLEELSHIDFHKDTDLAIKWVDTIPLDNIKYAKMFNNIQQNVSKEYHLGDIIIEQNLEKSRKCLHEIIDTIKRQCN